MFLNLWNTYLLQPTFNFLILIYNNWTDANLGWAVVYLTVILRFVLLPFTLINERNRIRNQELIGEIRSVEKAYSKDQILKKQEIRKILKKRKVQPWAKVIVLGIQALFLVLLYQVFVRGITGEKILRLLYPAVDFPGAINVNFYGFDLGMRHSWIWAGIVGVFLAAEIYVEFRKREGNLSKADLFYFVLFPASVFIFLYWLPMVKSLFILTSLVFSAIIAQFSKIIFRTKVAKA